MSPIRLAGCRSAPLGSYLKAIGVLRLVSEQADAETSGWWDGNTFTLLTELSLEDLLQFFLDRYAPTPIVAPWNGGSGFYPKDNTQGIEAIAGTSAERFREYRRTIAACREFPEVKGGKGDDEEERRTAILRRCRNTLGDRAVEWLDAAVGIAADGTRSFAPVLGTGGNEGRLDYTNNFMSRIAVLLITLDPKTPVAELLANTLLGVTSTGLQPGAAGQYDPGRAGGANQGPGIEDETPTNPWDLVLTLEGAVAWASGLYRRQGSAYRSVLCSPFTVRARTIGYGSASSADEARAEIWTPLWNRPVGYPELRALLREGRATVRGRPAGDTLEFAEAASSLGVDRGINRFLRYSLLKRRGDSYVALPTGAFSTGYRSTSDLVREFQNLLDQLRELTKLGDDLLRTVDSRVYQVLLTNRREDVRGLMAAFGRLLRRIVTTTQIRAPMRALKAEPWLQACEFGSQPEVRIAAALASIWTAGVGPLADNLSRADRHFAWSGLDLPARLNSVLDRRLQVAHATDVDANPLRGACVIDPGDTTLFIEGSLDDELVEHLLFSFLTLDWQDFQTPPHASVEVLPCYATLKCLFLPGAILQGEDPKRLVADRRILSLLAAGSIKDATEIAVHRLRVAGLRPLNVSYADSVDPRRLSASLLIPVWQSKLLSAGIVHPQQSSTAYI